MHTATRSRPLLLIVTRMATSKYSEWHCSAILQHRRSLRADTLVPNLTVRGQLLYAADLACPQGLTPAAKVARVNEIMQLLGLEGRHSAKIGLAYAPGISGEKRSMGPDAM